MTSVRFSAALIVLKLSLGPVEMTASAFDLDPKLVGACPGTADDVALAGDYAYLANGGSLYVIDIRDPTAPQRVGLLDGSGTQSKIAVAGDYACVATDYRGMDVIDIRNPAQPQRVGSLPDYQWAYRGVGARAGYVYLLRSRVVSVPPQPFRQVYSLIVVDVNNAASPTIVAQIDGGETNVFSAMAFQGNFGYLIGSRFTIFDATQPTSISVVGELPSVYGWSIAVKGDYAYIGGPFKVINIRDARNPTVMAGANFGGFIDGIASDNNYAVLAGFGSGIRVFDITDRTNPVQAATYDTVGYAYGCAMRGNYVYVADGSAGLEIFDVGRTAVPQTAGSSPTIDDTALGVVAVAAKGSYAYVADGYAGLVVIDASNAAAPRAIGRYDTRWAAEHVAVQGNYAYLLEASTGMHIVDVSDPTGLRGVGQYLTNAYLNGVAVEGQYAYVLVSQEGGLGTMNIIDLRNPAVPQLVGASSRFSGSAGDIAVRGGYAYVAAAWDGLQIFDVQSPSNPRYVAGLKPGGGTWNLALEGDYLYLATSPSCCDGRASGDLHVFDIRNPAAPEIVSHYAATGRGITVKDGYVYLAMKSGGLEVIDMRDLANPQRVGGNRAFSAEDVAVGAGYLFVAAGLDGLVVLDLYQPLSLRAEGWSSMAGFRLGIAGGRGTSVQLQRSGNLRDWSNWAEPFILDGRVNQRTDIDALGAGKFFYRAVSP